MALPFATKTLRRIGQITLAGGIVSLIYSVFKGWGPCGPLLFGWIGIIAVPAGVVLWGLGASELKPNSSETSHSIDSR